MELLPQWRDKILLAIDSINRSAGTTEEEFLLIGAHLQGLYTRSQENHRLASQLVALVSDCTYDSLVCGLRQITHEMDVYLETARNQNTENCSSLVQVLELLESVSYPLAAFHKMDKTLRMLGISTKIESSRLGDAGKAFTTLALDVEKLSCLVREKTNCIKTHRGLLEGMVIKHLKTGSGNTLLKNKEACLLLTATTMRFDELTALNTRCSRFGELAGQVSGEVSASINEVVSSLQVHDSMRQQMEHVTEALERLVAEIAGMADASVSHERTTALTGQVGDVCEVQVAQVQNASKELHGSVISIIANLSEIGMRQSVLSGEAQNVIVHNGASGHSLFTDIRSMVSSLANALRTCAGMDRLFYETLQRIGGTIQEISGFVSSIEEISAEINLLALNAQINAAHTGQEGVALGVLAEGIKTLSLEAVPQADALLQTLANISVTTETVVKKTACELNSMGERLDEMGEKVDGIVSSLEQMNDAISRLLTELVSGVQVLNKEITELTSGVSVHDTVAGNARSVELDLVEVVNQARSLVPATEEFHNNLLYMQDRYTMESERRVYESIARRHSGASEEVFVLPLASETGNSDSEFGDNVDLF